MTVTNEWIVSRQADYKKPEDLMGENGLLKLLTKKLVERALADAGKTGSGHACPDLVGGPG